MRAVQQTDLPGRGSFSNVFNNLAQIIFGGFGFEIRDGFDVC